METCHAACAHARSALRRPCVPVKAFSRVRAGVESLPSLAVGHAQPQCGGGCAGHLSNRGVALARSRPRVFVGSVALFPPLKRHALVNTSSSVALWHKMNESGGWLSASRSFARSRILVYTSSAESLRSGERRVRVASSDKRCALTFALLAITLFCHLIPLPLSVAVLVPLSFLPSAELKGPCWSSCTGLILRLRPVCFLRVLTNCTCGKFFACVALSWIGIVLSHLNSSHTPNLQ